MINFGFSKEKEKMKGLLENNTVWPGFPNSGW